MTAASQWGYTVGEQNRLIGSCPSSCGYCPAAKAAAKLNTLVAKVSRLATADAKAQ